MELIGDRLGSDQISSVSKTAHAIGSVKWLHLIQDRATPSCYRHLGSFESLGSRSCNGCQHFSYSTAILNFLVLEKSPLAQIVHFTFALVELGPGSAASGPSCSIWAFCSGRSCRTRPGWWQGWPGVMHLLRRYWAYRCSDCLVDHLCCRSDAHVLRYVLLIDLMPVLALWHRTFRSKKILDFAIIDRSTALACTPSLHGNPSGDQLERISGCSDCSCRAWSLISIGLLWVQLRLCFEVALLIEKRPHTIHQPGFSSSPRLADSFGRKHWARAYHYGLKNANGRSACFLPVNV